MAVVPVPDGGAGSDRLIIAPKPGWKPRIPRIPKMGLQGTEKNHHSRGFKWLVNVSYIRYIPTFGTFGTFGENRGTIMFNISTNSSMELPMFFEFMEHGIC